MSEWREIEGMREQYEELLAERNALIDDNNRMDDEIEELHQQNAALAEENLEFMVKAVNEHDSLVAEVERLEQIAGGVISNSNGIVTITTNHYEDLRQEVESYKEKEKICTSCEQHPSWQIRAEKAEAEVERLKEYEFMYKGLNK
jgi:cell division protein ZapA (FtsZ GTPase activity inhibitor)